MPRDLESEKQTLDEMPALSKETAHEQVDHQHGNDDDKPQPRDSLHPYVESLNLKHVDSLSKLESLAFPPNEACSREKFIYRLTKCGELGLGLFTSAEPESAIYEAPTASTGPPADSAHPARREILLAHIVATKTTNVFVTEDDMALPPDWQNATVRSDVGHNEAGRTVAVHSLAVLPQHQRQGLGNTLMKAYTERIESSEIADRVSLLAHDTYIPFYERLGFVNRGKSDVAYGGGGWYNMVLEFGEEGTSYPPGNDGGDEGQQGSGVGGVRPAVDGVQTD